MLKIDIKNLHWIKDDGKDDPDDLCAHGRIEVTLGNELIYGSESSCCVTATGLMLLRTLNEDYEPEKWGCQLFPCCGHFLYPNELENGRVLICGCPNGGELKIGHVGEIVHIETMTGNISTFSHPEYKEIVVEFCTKVEEFYGEPECKNIPSVEPEMTGFLNFWKEWHAIIKQHK